jgi:hypothetical protein
MIDLQLYLLQRRVLSLDKVKKNSGQSRERDWPFRNKIDLSDPTEHLANIFEERYEIQGVLPST